MKLKANGLAFRPMSIIDARYNLSIRENDILDVLFSKIESDNILDYRITTSELLKYYKDSSNVYRNLKESVHSLMGKTFMLYREGDLTEYAWISYARYHAGKKGEEVYIDLQISSKLKDLILEAKQGIFYKPSESIALTGKYSKQLYYHLCSKSKLKTYTDTFSDLLCRLNANYEYKDFKRRVLKPAIEEINEKTDLEITYKENKSKTKSGQQLVNSITFEISRPDYKVKIKNKETSDSDYANLNKGLYGMGEYKPSKTKYKQKGSFHQFQQRNYDFDAIEKAFLVK